MSRSLSTEELKALCELTQALYDERIAPDERARLEEWVCRDKEACRVYVQYMNLCASIHWDKTQEPALAPAAPPPCEARSPLLGFLADAFHSGIDLLSRPFALSILFAIVLPGAILAVLFVSLRSQPAEELAVRPTVSRPADVAPAVVAWVAQTHECEWEPGDRPLSEGTALPPGQPLRLRKGLAEITFAGGARVLLQGPATFDPKSASDAFLRAGSLVANVPEKARGFAVETPAAKVVDLGTEFGVAVEEEGLAADVHVFKGEVELTTSAAGNGGAAGGDRVTRHRLTAGRAGRAARASLDQAVAFVETAAAPDRFVRELPPAAVTKPRAIVADFSGGNGNAQPDQFPGAAGAGWVSGWSRPAAKGMRCTASVEKANPLLGGGDYLRVLVEEEPSAADARRGIERQLAVAEQVDLTKPYVVSFSLRPDAIGPFAKPSSTQLVLCSISKDKLDQQGARSGWHIRVDARDFPEVKARNWSFVSGDGKDGFRRVDSGIALRQGDVYSFRVLVDPAALRWTPSIAVNGGPWTSFAPMGMRSTGTARERGYWPYLYFYWVLQGEKQAAGVDQLGFSVDSIRITPADQ